MLPYVRGGEQTAGTGGLHFLRDALLLDIDGRLARRIELRVPDRTAEITRQRRSEEWHLPRKPGVVAWQRGQAVGRLLVGSVVELGRALGLRLPLIESPDQGAGDR